MLAVRIQIMIRRYLLRNKMEVSKTKLLMNNYLYLIDSIIFHVGCAIGFFEIDFTIVYQKKKSNQQKNSSAD